MKSKVGSLAGGREAVANAMVVGGREAVLPFVPDRTPGRIYEANSGLFNNAHYSEALTGYAQGWRDTSGVEEALEFFAPRVPAAKRFEYLELEASADFESDVDDRREVRGDFKRVKSTGTLRNGRLFNRGLTMTVDEDETEDDPNWRERKVGQLIKRLQRNSLMRAISLLSAAAVNENLTWDTTDGKDPDQDILGHLVLANNASGVFPNRVGYGHTAWSKRQLAHRAQDSAGGFASASLTPEALAGFFGVDAVQVVKSRYQSSPSAKSEVLGGLVLMFYAESGMEKEDPSNIKRFVQQMDGGDFRVYEWQEGSKLTHITVEHYENIVITSTLGIRKATIS